MSYKSKEQQRRYQRKWMNRRRRRWLDENGPCPCGATVDLEVHHRDPGRKVSHRVWSWKRERREAELAKCTVLCAACHREETTLQQRGELNVTAKLTRVEVVQIHRLAAAGSAQGDIAARYGVHRTTVGKILRGERWAHVHREVRAA